MTPQEFYSHYRARLDQYVNDHTRVIGRLEQLAIQRFKDVYQKDYFFDEKEFETKLKFCSLINVKNKSGKITQLVLADWQVFTIAHLCFYHTGSNTDRKVIDTVSLSFAGKQGKSTLAVLIALMTILISDKVDINIPVICPTQKQSAQILDYAKQIINNSPAITPFFEILHSNIIYKGKKTTSKILIVSSDPERIQGLLIDTAIIDEWYLATKESANVLDVVKSKQDTTVNPLTITIGTFSSKEHHNYESYYLPSIQILEGIIKSPNHFILYCAQDSELEIDSDPNVWSKSNPSLGVVKDLDVLIRKYNEVKIYPSRKKAFETESLNFWKETSLESPWLDMSVVNDSMRDDHELPNNGQKFYIGLDLSSNVDLSSISVLTEVDDIFYCRTINVMPNNERHFIKGTNELNLELLFVDDYEDFKQRNFKSYEDGRCVIRCQTPVLDENLIEDIIFHLSKVYNVYGVFYDRYKSHQLVQRLEQKGLYCEPVNQNMTTLSEPLKYWEKKMIMKEFYFGKNILTKWQFQQANIYELNGLMKLTKNKRKQSIDALVATNIAMTGYFIDNQSKLGRVLELLS